MQGLHKNLIISNSNEPDTDTASYLVQSGRKKQERKCNIWFIN